MNRIQLIAHHLGNQRNIEKKKNPKHTLPIESLAGNFGQQAGLKKNAYRDTYRILRKTSRSDLA